MNIADIILLISTFLEDLAEFLFQFEFFGNSLYAYTLSMISFILIFLTLFIVERFGIKWLRNRESLQSNDRMAKSIIVEVDNLVSIGTVSVLSLFMATRNLQFNQMFSLMFDLVLLGILIFSLFKFSFSLIDITIDFQKSEERDQGHVLSFLRLISKTIFASILVVWYLSLIGVNISALVAGLGIAGITIAFALQNIVADLFSAVAIYLDRPFEIGDYIEINDKAGRVERIGIRSTHIRSPDGPLVVISNQTLTSADIINHKQMNKRRVTYEVGVGSDTPMDQLTNLPTELTEVLSTIKYVEVDDIWLKTLGKYSWNYEIIYYISDPSVKVYRSVHEQINLAILKYMNRNAIELPYPINEIRVKSSQELAFN